MPAQTHLVARVVHQRDAALDTRERLLGTVLDAPGRVVLATCHRVEVYETVDRIEAFPDMRTLLAEEAAVHLFRVTTGLDSAVAGEPQILRQVRASYAAAARDLHPMLRRLFERALHVGREIRRSTKLGMVRRSVGSLAVDDALRSFGDPASATVLVIGAGEMGKLAVRALSRRVGRVLVANRDRSRAEMLAAGSDAVALGLDEIPGALARADVVISAADTRGTLLTRQLLSDRLRERSLVIVDIAVPRSVAPDARELDGLRYRTVDDLAADNVDVPASDVERAAERCSEEAAEFMREWRERAAAGVIRDVRARADTLRRTQLERALRRLSHLDERDRRIVEALSSGVTNAILHAPTVALREEPSRSDSARELFGIGRKP
ncbi:MAG TPA: glutamyl-tRNA reductase [Candidatus Limnocylindria bacterium]|nr:glutamyl-tRNA reductase [Candidatus Limnocylindria bacterium]